MIKLTLYVAKVSFWIGARYLELFGYLGSALTVRAMRSLGWIDAAQSREIMRLPLYTRIPMLNSIAERVGAGQRLYAMQPPEERQ